MATAGQITKIVAEALELPHSEVTSYFRVLREGGLMTVGGRGRSAPVMTSLDVSRLVICLMSAEALAQGVASTELVGALLFAGSFEADWVHLIDGPGDGRGEGTKWTEDVPEEGEDSLPSVIFEHALAALIELKADRRGAAEQLDWFPADLDGEIHVSVTLNKLRATIAASGIHAIFEEDDRTDGYTSPDDWVNLPFKERMHARTIAGGLTTTRSISETELYRLAKAITP
jgi:hypothetical protein